MTKAILRGLPCIAPPGSERSPCPYGRSKCSQRQNTSITLIRLSRKCFLMCFPNRAAMARCVFLASPLQTPTWGHLVQHAPWWLCAYFCLSLSACDSGHRSAHKLVFQESHIGNAFTLLVDIPVAKINDDGREDVAGMDDTSPKHSCSSNRFQLALSPGDISAPTTYCQEELHPGGATASCLS